MTEAPPIQISRWSRLYANIWTMVFQFLDIKSHMRLVRVCADTCKHGQTPHSWPTEICLTVSDLKGSDNHETFGLSCKSGHSVTRYVSHMIEATRGAPVRSLSIIVDSDRDDDDVVVMGIPLYVFRYSNLTNLSMKGNIVPRSLVNAISSAQVCSLTRLVLDWKQTWSLQLANPNVSTSDDSHPAVLPVLGASHLHALLSCNRDGLRHLMVDWSGASFKEQEQFLLNTTAYTIALRQLQTLELRQMVPLGVFKMLSWHDLTSLTELRFVDCRLDYKNKRADWSALTRLQKVYLQDCSALLLETVATCPNVTECEVVERGGRRATWTSTRHAQRMFAAVCQWPRLTRLDYDTDTGPSDWTPLERLSELRTLRLRLCHMGDVGDDEKLQVPSFVPPKLVSFSWDHEHDCGEDEEDNGPGAFSKADLAWWKYVATAPQIHTLELHPRYCILESDVIQQFPILPNVLHLTLRLEPYYPGLHPFMTYISERFSYLQSLTLTHVMADTCVFTSWPALTHLDLVCDEPLQTVWPMILSIQAPLLIRLTARYIQDEKQTLNTILTRKRAQALRDRFPKLVDDAVSKWLKN